jgi:hypothetical protein
MTPEAVGCVGPRVFEKPFEQETVDGGGLQDQNLPSLPPFVDVQKGG